MPIFFYKATEAGGKILKGTLEAVDERAVVAKLQDMGYIPIRITPVRKESRKFLDLELSQTKILCFLPRTCQYCWKPVFQ